MRAIKRMLFLIFLTCLCVPPGAFAEEADRVELFAVNVGKGDAIIIRAGDYACLVDGGKAYARGRVLSAMEYMGIEALDAVFLTHTDDDHGEGLEWLAQSDIPVGKWYASAMYTGVKEKKHPAVKAAKERNAEVIWLERGNSVPLGDSGAVFNVLAPFELNEDKDDNNSLVMMLESIHGRVLLTGDMELEQEAGLLSTGDDLSCHVLKAPNHGDDDTLSRAFAEAAGAEIAVISTSSYEKPGTPDDGVISRLKAAGTEIAVTQDSGLGIRVTLENGMVSVEYANLPTDIPEDIFISEAVPGDDVIVIANRGADRDMTGWYLYSEKGEEMFVFPDGYIIPAGENIVIGSKSSEGERTDLLWDEKNVIHKSKPDAIILYSPEGNVVSVY